MLVIRGDYIRGGAYIRGGLYLGVYGTYVKTQSLPKNGSHQKWLHEALRVVRRVRLFGWRDITGGCRGN